MWRRVASYPGPSHPERNSGYQAHFLSGWEGPGYEARRRDEGGVRALLARGESVLQLLVFVSHSLHVGDLEGQQCHGGGFGREHRGRASQGAEETLPHICLCCKYMLPPHVQKKQKTSPPPCAKKREGGEPGQIYHMHMMLASYPGLPSQLFFAAVEKSVGFPRLQKAVRGRPG